jgi:lipoate synthase
MSGKIKNLKCQKISIEKLLPNSEKKVQNDPKLKKNTTEILNSNLEKNKNFENVRKY